jgi:uncharacterized protein
VPMDPATRPFCSDRCRMADLGRWLSEDYRVPGGEPEAALDDEGGDGGRVRRDTDDDSSDH